MFQASLNELHAAMASGRDRSTKLHEENTNLAKKLQLLVEQYEAKDEVTETIIKIWAQIQPSCFSMQRSWWEPKT